VSPCHGAPGYCRGQPGAAGQRGSQGRAVQVEPMKPVLKATGTILLTLRYDDLLSSFAFNFKLRRHTKGGDHFHRTRQRNLPGGHISVKSAVGIGVISAVCFLTTSLLAAILYVYVVRRMYPARRRGDDEGSGRLVGRCRWPVSKPVLKAPMVAALETTTPYTASTCAATAGRTRGSAAASTRTS